MISVGVGTVSVHVVIGVCVGIPIVGISSVVTISAVVVTVISVSVISVIVSITVSIAVSIGIGSGRVAVGVTGVVDGGGLGSNQEEDNDQAENSKIQKHFLTFILYLISKSKRFFDHLETIQLLIYSNTTYQENCFIFLSTENINLPFGSCIYRKFLQADLLEFRKLKSTFTVFNQSNVNREHQKKN